MFGATTSATHYDVLGVPRNADHAVIRKAYLRASLRCHPDKNPGQEEEAKAEFVEVGQAYSVLGDPEKRAAYDRELATGKFTFRPQRPKTNGEAAGKDTSSQQNNASTQQPKYNHQAGADEDTFQRFADLFDETVAGMSEEELSMAMGVAAAVGSIIGSIAGSRASKGGNSALSAIGSAIGSAMASQAASTLVKTVHEDSKQRALEKREREAAIARGETVPESFTRGNRERVFQGMGKAFQNMGTSMGGSSTTTQTNENTARGADENGQYPENTARGGGEKGQFPWKEAAKLATMAVSACVEMQRDAKSSSDRRSR